MPSQPWAHILLVAALPVVELRGAIPLPGTGAWTGCLIALLLGYSLRLTFLSLALGTVGAGIIVGLLTALAVA